MVDGTGQGNPTRFINHSCSPNCSMKEIEQVELVLVAIFSCHTIRNGKELTCNYRMTSDGTGSMRCNCGNDLCCGFVIGGDFQFV